MARGIWAVAASLARRRRGFRSAMSSIVAASIPVIDATTGSGAGACFANRSQKRVTSSGSNWVPAWRRSSLIAFVVAHRPLVRPVVGHRVVGVGDRHDPGTERDVAPAQPERIAVARVALVVVEDDRHRLLERGRLLEDDLADPRVLDDRPPLGRRERRRLVEDLLRDRDLADVVEQRGDRIRSTSACGRARFWAIATTIEAISADGWPL